LRFVDATQVTVRHVIAAGHLDGMLKQGDTIFPILHLEPGEA
jgi:hypothetical protein